MTDDSKAQKATRNSKLVERYRSTSSTALAFAFDADWWENVCAYAQKPAYIDRIQKRLDMIEADGLMVFPSVFYKSKIVRKAIRETKRLIEQRAFKRNR